MIRSDGVRMLTVGEYAEKHNCSSKTVWHWCKTGRLQGAIKEPNAGGAYAGFKFRIPEDAEPFPPKRVYERKAPPKPKPRVAPAPKKLNTDHDKSMHIRKHRGTKSIRELAKDTGLTTEEVRRRYERLFECGDG